DEDEGAGQHAHGARMVPVRIAPGKCGLRRDASVGHVVGRTPMPPPVPRTCRAVVQTAPRRLELRELPVPEIDDDSALLRVEACGICASDAEQYAGVLPVRLPVVPGHEPLGVIERIGERAAKRWGVDVGDRVAVESIIRCGHCRACIAGRYQLCRGRGGLFGHGYVPLDRPPGLWGAYADYM